MGISAAQAQTATAENYEAPNFMDSEAYDPRAENIEEILEAYDAYYEQETGESAWLHPELNDLLHKVGGCYRYSCPVFIYIKKSEQRAYLHLNGKLAASWKVSTGLPGYSTPNFDKHPNGRIYNKYTSSKYPGGDYQGLGNMPYAVFIRGGYALHGTPKGNWSKLGRRASHGCIRMHPDNAKWFNRLVRQHGISKVWITVE